MVRVVPDVAGFDKQFDYVVRAEANQDTASPMVQIGSLVKVRLAGRQVEGWIVDVDVPALDGVALKDVEAVVSFGPSTELVALAQWAAHRWAGRWGAVLKSASPPRRIKRLAPQNPSTSGSRGEAPINSHWRTPGVTVVRTIVNDDQHALIAEIVAADNALVLAPQNGVAQRIAGALERAGRPVRTHPKEWEAAASRGGVVVGTRSAVWARVPQLAVIVVVDEHDEALQEERNPTWHARDVAIERAQRLGIPVVLLSPYPSLDALTVADRRLEPDRDHERQSWPIVEVIDQRDTEPGRSGLFSSRAIDVLRTSRRALAILNRKGRAVMLACAACGTLVVAEKSGRLMIERDGMLVCPSTGETRPVVCAACRATKMKRLRLGVGRAVEELSAMLGEEVGEITADAKPGTASHRVSIGTEAALYRMAGVHDVVFLDFDQELGAHRFRAVDQAMSLMVKAARLVGPRSEGGRVVIQTRQPDHRLLTAVVRSNPKKLLTEERSLREALNLPPFVALAEVSGANVDRLAQSLQAITEERNDPDLAVMGPRDDGHYLVRASSSELLADALAEGSRRMAAERVPRRWRVVVNPQRA